LKIKYKKVRILLEEQKIGKKMKKGIREGGGDTYYIVFKVC